jgi:hypothetical protein
MCFFRAYNYSMLFYMRLYCELYVIILIIKLLFTKQIKIVLSMCLGIFNINNDAFYSLYLTIIFTRPNTS